MPSTPLALAFDLDGTLVDSLADLAASANHVRRERGQEPLPVATIRTYIGNGARKLVQRTLALPDEPADLIDQALRDFRSHYRDHCLDRTRPYPGVRETLEALGPLPMAVVSNKPQPFTELVIEGLGLRSHFAAVVGARPGVPVKPAPDLLRLACVEMGVDVVRTWIVGDSMTDVGAGLAAGCGVVGVTYGLGSLDEAPEGALIAMLDSLPELLSLLSH